VFEKKKVAVGAERSTRDALTDAEVRALLAEVDRVVVTRGRATVLLDAAKTKPADLHGPTGKIRAPLVRRGRTLLVGFHRDSLAALLGGR
jgi:hypothetical protein